MIILSCRSIALLPKATPFQIGDAVLVRRSAGPAKGRNLYQAVALISDVRDYNYRLKWLTQGPAVTKDVPGTESDRFWPHRHLAKLPRGVSLRAMSATLAMQTANSSEGSAINPQSMLAKRLSEISTLFYICTSVLSLKTLPTHFSWRSLAILGFVGRPSSQPQFVGIFRDV
mgnify:CR=1 FL=1